jgi:sugar lactone lactonase YvrE
MMPTLLGGARVYAQAGTIDTPIGGNNGDGSLATNSIVDPQGIDIFGQDLYIADTHNNRIRRVNGLTGIITTVVGTGERGFTGDGGPATQATLSAPADVALDAAGRIYIADLENRRVRRVNTNGVIETVAGNGLMGYRGDGVLATTTSVGSPEGVFVDNLGNLYIADTSNQRVRRVDPNGIITTFAGNGESGYSGDGGPATQARL